MRKHQSDVASGRIEILRDVPYMEPTELRDPSKQQLDVYLPKPPKGQVRKGLPLVVHFHGGGWQHGDRSNEYFGAPAVARSHAAAGCVVVTPSYRLGSTDFMVDAQCAVLWAVNHAATLGADPNRLYLSGHSAGGNIAALLAVGPWLASPILPSGTIKGVIGLSGVYSLVKPLGGFLSWYKNRIFERHVRNNIFGEDLETLVRYSPTALVRLDAGKASPFKPRCALGKLAHSATNSRSSSAASMNELPPFLLLNASWDLGLEDDAAYFAKSLAARTGTKPAHETIANTNHATVSWDEATFERCREFIASCESNRD